MKAKDLVRKRIATYRRVFDSPDGQFILEDLKRQFGGTTLKKVDGVIDPNASLAAAGCQEVYLYIEQLSNIEIPEEADAAA